MTTFTARPTGSSPDAELRWIDMHASETADHPGVVDAIQARRLDGVTIEGVLTEEEAAAAVRGLDDVADLRRPAMFGSMLGMPLAELPAAPGGVADRAPYLDDAATCRAICREAFGFDVHQRVAAALTPLAGGRRIDHPWDGDRPYSAGNVRWYAPGSGGLPGPRRQRVPRSQTDGSTAHLRTTTRIRDHFSWFVVLQPPETGGALSVFDLEFEASVPRVGGLRPGRARRLRVRHRAGPAGRPRGRGHGPLRRRVALAPGRPGRRDPAPDHLRRVRRVERGRHRPQPLVLSLSRPGPAPAPQQTDVGPRGGLGVLAAAEEVDVAHLVGLDHAVGPTPVVAQAGRGRGHGEDERRPAARRGLGGEPWKSVLVEGHARPCPQGPRSEGVRPGRRGARRCARGSSARRRRHGSRARRGVRRWWRRRPGAGPRS